MKDKWLTRIAWTIAIITGLCLLWIWSLPYPLKTWLEAKKASRYQSQWPISEGEYREIVDMVNQKAGFRDVISGFDFYDTDPSRPDSPSAIGDTWQKARVALGAEPPPNSIVRISVLQKRRNHSGSNTLFILLKKAGKWEVLETLYCDYYN
ncbi:MAG: hypothetical protein RL095_3667 [Verrucomicrobiota bacterium]|jgi:hypothetical protein